MRLRRRTPHERIDLALAKMLERDWKIKAPRFSIVSWSRDADGVISITASDSPYYRKSLY